MLKNKIVAITGGAGLIGREFARAIVQNGGIAVIADVDTAIGVAVRDQLRIDLGTPAVEFEQMDITSEASVRTVIDKLHAQFGRIDALVNSAYPKNRNYGRLFFDVKYEDFCDNVSRNLGGYFLTSQKFAEYFLLQGSGNIVNVASVYGVIPPKFEIYFETGVTMPVEYAAIKSALLHLTKYMAKFLKGKNIRVNAISPGGIWDKQPELLVNAYRDECLNKGMLEPADLRGTLVYLLSEMSAFVNGQNMIVDDGFSL